MDLGDMFVVSHIQWSHAPSLRSWLTELRLCLVPGA